MAKRAKKISSKWIEQTREYFRDFLDETDFPNPDRTGERGPKFQYPEWLIKAEICLVFQRSPLVPEFGRQKSMTLVTSSRRKVNKTENRIKMHRLMRTPKLKQIYKERSYRVEPMQGLVKDIFDLDRCWMRGNSSNRWLFAAMGVTVQMHQLTAFKEKRSTWKIKNEVLG